MARREALGVGRQDILYHVTGNANENFRVVKLSENVGIESQESVQIYRDVAYWLWKDGVYEWGPNGIMCVSDGEGGKGQVRSWFNTSSYFNSAVFSNAFGRIDPIRNRYQLFLAAAGDSTINRWVEFDLADRTWWGPHLTSAFTPTCAFVLPDANNVKVPVIGSSNGFIWQEQATRTDDTATGIALDVDTKSHDADTPDIEKYFGQLSMISKVQAAGTLVVTPTVGGLGASAGAAINHLLTSGRERLRRLGTGRFCKLNFTHSTAGQDVEVFGYEIPFHELGRR
jgi:hypothetical protein